MLNSRSPFFLFLFIPRSTLFLIFVVPCSALLFEFLFRIQRSLVFCRSALRIVFCFVDRTISGVRFGSGSVRVRFDSGPVRVRFGFGPGSIGIRFQCQMFEENVS